MWYYSDVFAGDGGGDSRSRSITLMCLLVMMVVTAGVEVLLFTISCHQSPSHYHLIYLYLQPLVYIQTPSSLIAALSLSTTPLRC